MDNLKSQRTTVKRIPDRGKYDTKTINAIIDEAMICHVGFVFNEIPYVIPTIHARNDKTLYLHGSAASRMLKALDRSNLCVTMTLMDGIVLARSLFHHSMNYRSVVLLGEGRIVDEKEEKLTALKAVSDHLIPERWEDARKPSEKEMNATTVVAIRIEEASAKIRTGPPGDDEEDYALPVWAGVMPIYQSKGELIPDPRLDPGIVMPDYLKRS